MVLELSFGSWLKRRRRGLGLTQRALANQVGYAEVTLRKVEADELRPSHQMAEKLADALQLAPDERLHFVRFARDELGLTEVELPTQSVDLVTPPYATNLPAPMMRLIGRATEVEVLLHLITQEKVRLLTLTGVGGTGKTRLAIEAATHLLKEFRDGVFLVGLASLVDPELIASEIAKTLAVSTGPQQAIEESLKKWLHTRQILLVMDNFEHLLAGVHLLTDLLAAAAQLTIIVTSREPLHLYGEYELPVAPLEVPNPSNLPSPAVLIQIAAVTLFVQRVQAVQPTFTLTMENAWEVAELCVRLDGLPLAIELAAARTKLLSPRAMLARLGTRFSWLTSATRDLPARHQRLIQTIAWSYDLLDADEQTLLAHVAVHHGGGTLEAIEAVCSADLAVAVLDGLSSLVDKNLLVYRSASGDDVRIGMLETIRAFALERLEERGEMVVARCRHAEYYLALAEKADGELRGAGQERWLARLQEEHDNLRAALDWAFECGEVTYGLRLSSVLAWFWELRGYFEEGEQRLTAFLAQVERNGELPAERAARARALNASGRLAYRQGRYTTAKALLEESLARAREVCDRALLLLVLHNLGNIAVMEGNIPLAHSRHSEGLQIAQDTQDTWGIAWSHMGMGHVAIKKKDYATAHNHFRQSLVLRRSIQDQWGIARSLNELGDVTFLQHNYAAAIVLYEESLVLHRRLAHKSFIANVLYNLGWAFNTNGQPEKAISRSRESFAIYLQLGQLENSALCLVELGKSACSTRQPVYGARFFATADMVLATSGFPMTNEEVAQFQATLADLQEQLGEAAFAKAWAEGQASSLEQMSQVVMRWKLGDESG